MKRGIIYSTARKHGYNVVAMGQHLDDMAESFMMSFWLNGKLRTQKACYTVDEGDLRFIRPFVWVREADLKQFALEKKLPVISGTVIALIQFVCVVSHLPSCFRIVPSVLFRAQRARPPQDSAGKSGGRLSQDVLFNVRGHGSPVSQSAHYRG